MIIGRYRLLGQVGAGRDGVAYRAQAAATDAPIELRVLTAAHADATRWAHLVHRLRLAALLDHPAALRLVQIALDHEPPFVAVEWLETRDPAYDLAALVPLPVSDAINLVLPLANLLAAAHRLGLVHGQIPTAGLRLTAHGQPRLDFTDIDLGAARTETVYATDALLGATLDEVPLDPAVDVRDLGLLLRWLVTGNAAALAVPEPLEPLLKKMLAADPADRASARDVEGMLTAALAPPSATIAAPMPVEPMPSETPTLAAMQADGDPGEPASEDRLLTRGRLGRFRLLQKLGQGGMGAVYRAEDPVDGKNVAIKVLRPDWAKRPEALRRFHKEARMLAEVNNPYVANLLEINEDDGAHYIVLEFVEGTNLGQRLSAEKRFDEPTALAIVADVARGLAAAHERGIIHRDVKPENILLTGVSNQESGVKLSDFGLARHVLESESLNVTQAGALLGTPHYMAPEQFAGAALDARADVYSLGATLYHLLAGRPPFVANTVLAVAAMHTNDPPAPLRQINKDVSDGTCQLLERMLAKAPEARPADAGAVLRELERLLRGEPSDLAVHPRLPEGDPGRVLRYDWSWELHASPRQLWPYVSNTDRVNRAVGLPAIEYSTQAQEAGVERIGKLRKLGVTSAYREHPFEWIEAQRMGVLREFTSGPFKWLVSITELIPRAGGGTTLNHQVRIEPHGLMGRTVAAVEVGIKGRRSLDRVYRRIDAALTGQLGAVALVDPFEEPAEVSRAQQRRLDELLDRLTSEGVDPGIAERLADFLAHAPAQEVARIRPLALARRLGMPPDAVITACLRGARAGLFVLLWDLLCPICRIPSEIKDTLRALKDHGHCEACNADYELDFARSVEMIFRVHPDIRKAELGVYCIAGPSHSPHVVAQVRLAPGERVEMELSLAEGSYRLRGPQLPYALDFRVQPGAALGRWDVALGAGIPRSEYRVLRPGTQLIAIKNEHAGELVVRVERTTARDDALTAARAASLSLFRELFPAEVLSPGHLVSVATVTLLVTDLDLPAGTYARLGDAPAFAIIHEHFRLLDERIRRSGGALIKTVGEGLVAVFDDPAAAVETALDLQSVLRGGETTRALRLKVAVHRGPAMAATLNDHLDYFGATVQAAAQLPAIAHGGEVILTQSVAGDARVAALLAGCGLATDVVAEEFPEQSMGPLLRLEATT